MKHIELIETAKEAIKAVFADTSVPSSQTKESLEELRDEIDMLIDTVNDSP